MQDLNKIEQEYLQANDAGEADWQYRDTVDAETVSDKVEAVQKLLADARNILGSDHSFYSSQFGKQIYNLLRDANIRCDNILTLCVYDARGEV